MAESAAVAPARLFLSWTHRDRKLKEALLADLLPALGMYRDLSIEWWEDSHLTCGQDLVPGIVDRLDEADFGVLLLSNPYFGSSFIQRYELPRFAGTGADKGSLPVALKPLPGFGASWNMGGIERQVVFTSAGRSFAEVSGAGRTRFANELADAIRRRIRGLNGYRSL
ncbi:MAG TPA: hypothetical protein VFQ77_05735 [Pseudonocardiaceae bacterium]|jgi:hypothetical protein|nr:hypothetical protein [Pseudonocardiaceae bacterium]